MDGLLVKNIPQPLLARILIQLNIIPQHLSSHIDLLQTIAEGYRAYEDGCDLDGLLTYCQKKSIKEIEEKINTNDNTKPIVWPWCHLTLSLSSDWDHLNEERYNRIDTIGLRLQITSEIVRPGIDLIKYGMKKSLLLDKKFVYQSEGRRIPIDNILNGTLTHISNHSNLKSDNSNNNKLISMINQRLNQFKIDTEKFQQSQKESEIDYILAGVLMVRYDALFDGGMMDDAWCLYLRDYVGDDYGSKWRIISGISGQDSKISSEQALSDIRGTPFEGNKPSAFSIDYRPVYLFYCNYDLITRSVAEESILDKTKDTKNKSPASSTSYPISNGVYMMDSLNNDIHMTGSSDIRMTDSSESSSLLTSSNSKSQIQLKLQQQNNNNDYGSNSRSYGDYSYENNNYIEVMDDDDDNENNNISLENEVCKHCGIPDSIDDVNTIFFCDLCDLGVHQLCEDPPISSYEMQIDPWYCRDCSKIIKSTLPQDQTPQSDHDDDDDRSNTKRQRLE